MVSGYLPPEYGSKKFAGVLSKIGIVLKLGIKLFKYNVLMWYLQ